MYLRWIVGFTVLIFVLGMVAMLGLSNIELLSPLTSQAKVERISAENRHLDVMNHLKEQRIAARTEAEIAHIRHKMEMEEARYQAELARIAAEQAYRERMLNIKANAYENFATVLLIIGSAAGISFIAIGTKFALARIPAAAAAPTPAVAKQPYRQAARCHSPNGYEQERINARQRELLDRYITLRRVRATCNGTNMTPDEYKKLPLAGD